MNFSQFLNILLARKWLVLGTVFIAVLTTVAINLLLPKRYTAAVTMVLDVTRPDPVSGMFSSGSMSSLGSLTPSYLATQVKIIESHNVALKVVDNLKLADSTAMEQQFLQATGGMGSVRDWLANGLLQSLKVVPDHHDGSSTIEIDFEGSNPKFAALMANAFADAYIKTNLDLRVEPARQTTSWFDDQIKELRGKWEQAQARLSDYQLTHGIVAVDERIDVENSRLSEITSQLVALQSQAVDSQSREKSLNDTTASGGSLGGLPDVINNTLVTSLKEQLAQSEVKLDELGKQIGKNNPDYQRAQDEVQGLRRRVDEAVNVATSGIVNNAAINRQREIELRQELADQKTKVLELKRQRDEVDLLSRDVQNSQQVYDAALARISQSRLESNTTQTDAVVLDAAIPPVNPSSPRMLINTLIAVTLGTMLGIGVALAVEISNPRVRSGEDLASALGVPLIGTYYLADKPLGRWWAVLLNRNRLSTLRDRNWLRLRTT